MPNTSRKNVTTTAQLPNLQLFSSHLRSLQALLTSLSHVRYALALFQKLESIAFDSLEVHEHIVAAILRTNESENLFIIEPLDCPILTVGHLDYLAETLAGAFSLRGSDE